MQKEHCKNWLIEQRGYDPGKNDFFESIFSQGNGYMGVRGFVGCELDRRNYELCTYIAGIFDYFKPGVTDMVNTPNYLFFRLWVDGVELDLNNCIIHDFSRELNMKDGTLAMSFIWESGTGQETKVEIIRLLSIADIHNAATRYCITPLNHSGAIRFETGVDAKVVNNPISDVQTRDDLSPVEFLHETGSGITDDSIGYVTLKTSKTGYTISEAFSTVFSSTIETVTGCKRETHTLNKYISESIDFRSMEGNQYTIDKVISVYTSRDMSHTDIIGAALTSVRETAEKGFEYIHGRNRDEWAKKWEIADIVIEGDDDSQLAVRYNIFQLIQTNAENDPRASIGARGLMHGRYKGCYFWDTEIFMLPFFVYTNPKAAKNLLMYRYHTLPGAEWNASTLNLDGARYAWMCTIDGREQCETWDTGACEIHITADIAYAIDHYFRATGDEEFIRDYGTEMLIKTARDWKSRFTYQEDRDCYNMLFVKGPNEYGGVTLNNTYTTMMALNNLNLAMKAIDFLKCKYPEKWFILEHMLDFDAAEMDSWKHIIDKAVINYDNQMKLYIEDDNFLKLELLDIEKYKTDDSPLYYRISYDRLQRYRVLKQADIILLMSLLSEKFAEDEKKAAWDFYEPITLHDSTLSFGTHAQFAARLGIMDKAFEYFIKSLRLDLDDVMKNTGREGIHFAAFGATWQALVNGFGGVVLKYNGMSIDPVLPDKWMSLKFKLIYRRDIINVSITHNEVDIYLDETSASDSIELIVRGRKKIIQKRRNFKNSVEYIVM
mgnify:CR=1 FL=1